MQDLILERYCYAAHGTFGRLILAGGIELFTAEKPWKNNIPFDSCIPEGWYQCAPRTFMRFGYLAIEVKEVPHRTHILFHRGNTPHHVKGCIVVGTMPGCVQGYWGVHKSEEAFKTLMAAYGGKTFQLHITHTAHFLEAATWQPST